MSLISIIIPTRNRCDLLAIAAQSSIAIAEADGGAEVIVVDNGSSDGTKALCAEMQKASLNFRYIYDSRPGLHTGRHTGMRAAKGDILVFADDDIEPMPTWLQAINDSFKDEDVVLVGGKCLPKFECDPPEWVSDMWKPNTNGEQILGYLSLIDLGNNTKLTNPYNVFGCNFAIRHSVLLEAGGFHPDSVPQELIRYRGDGESHVSNYILSKGYQAVYNPRASIYHYVPKARMTEEYFCRRAYNQGVSDSYTAIRSMKGLAPLARMSESEQQGWFFDFCRRVKNKPLQEVPGALLRRARRLFSVQSGASLHREIKAEDQPFTKLHQKIKSSYDEGYTYHQTQVKASPDLLFWVLRPDYFDCQVQMQKD